MSPLPWLRSNPTHEWSQDALLLAWHRTLSSPDKLFSGCPKQSERGFIRENDYSCPQQSNPCNFCRISVCPWCFSWREVASLLPFGGHPAKVFASLCMQIHSHPPAAIPEQALFWWCPAPAAESNLGDGPGACWTFGTCFLAGNHCWQRRNNDSKHHPPFEASSLLYKLNQHNRVISSLVLVNTHTCVNERITDMMSAGPFVAGLKCSGTVFGGDSVAKRDFAINCNSSDHSS